MLLIKKQAQIWQYHAPTHFTLEAIIIRSYPWCQEDSSSTSWNLSPKFIYTILRYEGF